MSNDTFQETLFADPVGLRFRHAREGKRWSRESVAQQLKLPVAVIEAMEREDWERLGAPIYARSFVSSYAKLLGLPASVVDEIVRARPQATTLVAMGGVPAGKRMIDRGLLNLAYLGITAAIVGSIVMLAMHYQSPAGNEQVLTLETTAENTAAPAPAPITPPAAAPIANPPPVLASMAPTMPASGVEPVAPAAATAAPGDLVLRFRGDSWVEVLDPNGARVERGLVTAGSERRFARGQVGQVTLGNADAVEVSQAGRTVDLAAFRQANVARFGVSSDGRLAPPGG
jgi:cytoskeleton protein RodZ